MCRKLRGIEAMSIEIHNTTIERISAGTHVRIGTGVGTYTRSDVLTPTRLFKIPDINIPINRSRPQHARFRKNEIFLTSLTRSLYAFSLYIYFHPWNSSPINLSPSLSLLAIATHPHALASSHPLSNHPSALAREGKSRSESQFFSQPTWWECQNYIEYVCCFEEERTLSADFDFLFSAS